MICKAVSASHSLADIIVTPNIGQGSRGLKRDDVLYRMCMILSDGKRHWTYTKEIATSIHYISYITDTNSYSVYYNMINER